MGGSLPGVPVWAAAVDSTCVHRNKNVCGVEGECGFYDNGKIAVLFLLLGGIPKLLSFMFFFLGSSVLYRRMPDLAKRSYNKDSGSEAGSGDAEALQNKL